MEDMMTCSECGCEFHWMEETCPNCDRMRMEQRREQMEQEALNSLQAEVSDLISRVGYCTMMEAVEAACRSRAEVVESTYMKAEWNGAADHASNHPNF